MKDWKEELIKKAQDLNLTEGGGDSVSNRFNSRSNIRDSDRRSRSIRLSRTNREINKINQEKGGEKMITSRGALDDYEAICKEEIDATSKLVKIFKIVIKLLLGIRTNQVGGVKKDREQRPPVKTE